MFSGWKRSVFEPLDLKRLATLIASLRFETEYR